MGVLGDISDGLNSGLKVGKDLYDGGKKLVGEGIDKGTDIVGGGLDMVGAHDWADKVEHYGDKAASALGATPGEQELGESDDPTDLVHGNAKDIQATAKHLKDFHTAFEKVGQGMRKLDSSQWKGEAADTSARSSRCTPSSGCTRRTPATPPPRP